MLWRGDDEVLLQRLEDEVLVAELFGYYTGGGKGLHARAAGLVSELRKLPGGAAAVTTALDGDTARLGVFVDRLVLKQLSPELLHHLALFHARGARMSPTAAFASTAWVRSLAAWLALVEERAYLAKLEVSVTGGPAKANVIAEVIDDLAALADAGARELTEVSQGALLALGRVEEAARQADVSPDVARAARGQASRRRNAAIELSLASIDEGLDEAAAQGALATTGRTLLLRAVPVWSWSGQDEGVEHFVVGKIEKIGWELYRARKWDDLRYLLDPFRPMLDSLARRIERDSSQIAYAAACAEMYMFMAEVERDPTQKLELAERSVRICPTHRNGRLVLASVLCSRAIEAMQKMALVVRKTEVERMEKLLERVESLYPKTSDLPEARGMLERVKRGTITLG